MLKLSGRRDLQARLVQVGRDTLLPESLGSHEDTNIVVHDDYEHAHDDADHVVDIYDDNVEDYAHCVYDPGHDDVDHDTGDGHHH